MKTIISVSLVVFLLALTGCGSRMGPQPSASVVGDENFLALWDAAMEVLREHRFVIDRADKRAGVITTFPMVSRQWFEFWRSDAVTARDVLESSLQTIYRQVTVRIRRKSPDSPYYSASVSVSVSRSDRLNPQITSTSEAYDLFLSPGRISRSESLTGLSGSVSAERQVEVGRDAKLEKLLQNQINRLAAKKLTILRE